MLKGFKHTKETREKMSNIHKGIKRPPFNAEWRKKLSLAKIGKSSPRKGVILSEEIKKKMGLSKKGRHFSPATQFKKGQNAKEKNINWKGGISRESDKIRHSQEGLLWRKQIFARDKYECQICGAIGVYLHANHIKKFSDYPALRTDLNNGITLCKDCHKMVTWHEVGWESYFKFNLEARNIVIININ